MNASNGKLAAHSQRNNDLLQAAKRGAAPVSDRRIRPDMLCLHLLPSLLQRCNKRLAQLGIGAVQIEKITAAPKLALVQITYFPPLDRIAEAELTGIASWNGERFEYYVLPVGDEAEICWRKPVRA